MSNRGFGQVIDPWCSERPLVPILDWVRSRHRRCLQNDSIAAQLAKANLGFLWPFHPLFDSKLTWSRLLKVSKERAFVIRIIFLLLRLKLIIDLVNAHKAISTVYLDIFKRKPSKVDSIDITKRDFTSAIFFVWVTHWPLREWLNIPRKRSNQMAWNFKITGWVYSGSYWISNTYVRRKRETKTSVFRNVSTIQFAVLPVVQSLVSIASPSHGRPPPSGGGLLQKRTLVLFSLPQHFFVHLVQEFQAPQLPWIAENTIRKVHGLVHG